MSRKTWKVIADLVGKDIWQSVLTRMAFCAIILPSGGEEAAVYMNGIPHLRRYEPNTDTMCLSYVLFLSFYPIRHTCQDHEERT